MKFKRLIPALAMLLVSAILLGTSTFAWFSMNTTVTATGLQITAKSDNTYLLIGEEALTTAADIQNQTGADLTTEDISVTDANAKVYPAAPAISNTEIGYLATTSGHKTTTGADITTAGAKVENHATAAAYTNWYTANALAPDAAAIDAGTAKQLGAFANYVIVKTVKLTVAEGYNDANNLRVTATITAKDATKNYDAVKILITTDDGGFATLDKDTTSADIKGNNTAITETTVRTVSIYVYYDGNDSTVFTNGAADLTGADINLQFDVDAVPAA